MEQQKRKTIKEAESEYIALVKNTSSFFNISEWYREGLINGARELFEQLGKAEALGKILQEICLEHMTAAELKAAIDKKMLHAEVTDEKG